MATSSITKNFYVQDEEAYKKLKQELVQISAQPGFTESPSLKKGREKLAAFVFCES